MKFEIQASIVILGLCALVCTCTYASGTKQLTDLIDSEWLEDKYSDQKYLVAELIEARGSDETSATHEFIKQLHDDLQSVHKRSQKFFSYGEDSDYDEDEDSDDDEEDSSDNKLSNLGAYRVTFEELMDSLGPRIATRFRALGPKLNSYWFDELRNYLDALMSIKRMADHRCLSRVWMYYAQTIGTLYGQDLDAFLAGESKLYPKLQAFLLRYGKRALEGCVKAGEVLGDKLDAEDKLDDILRDYGHLNYDDYEVKLYGLAERLDLVAGEFDSKRMIACAPPISVNEVMNDGKKITFDQFYARLHLLCASYGQDTIKKSVVSSLASLLVPEIDLQSGLRWSMRASKLKEYERIYSKFCSASKADVAANFERNKPQSKCGKLLCGLGLKKRKN